MSWNLTDQRAADLGVLWELFIGADQDTPVQSLEAIENALKSHGVSKMRVAHALDNLVSARCATKAEKGYYITSRGVDWVEDTFTYTRNSKTNYTFYPRHSENTLGVLQKDLKGQKAVTRAPADTAHWTKIGAIAAVISILVAIFLWWLS